LPIHIPRIDGTVYDYALNEFIDSVNSEVNPDQPKLAAHAVAAIGRFLIENHEVEAGTRWIQKATPPVEHIAIVDSMVDKLYDPLAQRAKRGSKSGCGGVAAILIAPAIASGLAWWFTR